MYKPPAKLGFTLIETVIAMSLMAFMFLAIFSLITTNLTLLFSSKIRSTSIGLAQEKLEELKNLPYDSLATKSGSIYPAGTILDEEIITRNGLKLNVVTDIRYVDNQFDGNLDGTVPSKPVDLYPYDYKKATITIMSTDKKKTYARLSTDIAAKTAETAGNTGVLIVKVIDANGNPIEAANVSIVNTQLSPAVGVSTQTDVLGQVVIPKLPPDTAQNYHIEVTKAGYSSEKTYPINGSITNPANPDFGLVAQQTVTKTFAIDKVSNLSMTVYDQSGQIKPGVTLDIRGEKQLGSSPIVYKYSQSYTTDQNGKINIASVEWDSYVISANGYTVLSTTPYQPLGLSPDLSLDARITLVANPSQYPVISQINPISPDITTSTIIDITGSNLSGSASVVLRKAGQPDRGASSVNSSGADSLSATFNLVGIQSGAWDVVVTISGRQTIQYSGVIIP